MVRIASRGFGRFVAVTIAMLAVRGVASGDAPVVVPSVGGAAWTADDVTKLDADLDGILASARAVAGAHVGAFAVETATGRVLYRRLADDEFQPASTLKLIVGSAALDLLGPAFHATTSASFGPTSIEIVPDGDPFFGVREADALAVAVRNANVRHVDDVVVETPGDTAPLYPDGWTFDDFAEDYAAPVSPATFEENVVHLHVTPGAAVGAIVTVATTPAISVLAPSELACSRTDAFLTEAATTGPPKSATTLDVVPLLDGCRELVGSLALGDAASDVDVAVPDPSLYLARAVVAALRSHGIRVRGEGSERHDPRAAGNDYSWPGAPLRDLLPRFWIPSDNFVGETLLMHLVPVDPANDSGDAANPRERALEVERDWLRSIGVDPATTTLADGSGLSQYDRITPRDLVTILEHDWNGPYRQIVLDALPIGGSRGTIEGIAGTPAAGRVFAKTGSMMHVRGLAGYLATQRHGAVTFAFEVDDWIGAYPELAKVRAAVLGRIVQD